jgi:Carboxypeptidase regulatory-like domain
MILGTVADAQGGVLPGVTLTLRNVESGLTRTTVTEENGTYRLPGLLPGKYDLTAELSGFANAEAKDLTITIGLELRRDLTMALQGLQETLTVTGEAPVVETTQTEVASVVTQEQIESLPIANRQPISLALLLPGTSMDQTSVRRAQANVGAGGSANTMSIYHVDGGMNMSNNSGQQHLEVPQSAIREFKVNVSQSSAEFGAVGGVVLTATKSGTNRFSGEVFEYFRDKSLNAMDKFEEERHDQFGDPKPDFRKNSWGGAFGGPIIRDRLHFFVASEVSSEKRTATVKTGQPQFYSALEGNFPSKYDRRAYFARGDFQITSQQSLFVRYAYDSEKILCETCGGFNANFFGVDVLSPRDSNLVAHTWVIGPRALNEIHAQIPPSHLDNRNGPPGLDLWPSSRKGEFPAERFNGYTQIYRFPSLNWGSNSWSMNYTHRWEARDDFSLHLGNHDFKFGGAYVDLHSPEEQSNNIGQWQFATDQFFDGSEAAIANLSNPIQFTASFPPLLRDLKNHWIQGYVQDEWRVRPSVTVSLGLRYDNQYRSFNNHLDLTPVPQLRELIDPTVRGDNNNFGPRAGIAWDLRNDGRSVLRSAYGVYYQYVMQGGLRPELTALRQTMIVIRNPTYPDPYGGRTPESFASTAPPNVNIVDANLRNARSSAVTLGFSQELKPSLAVHLDGVYTNVADMTQRANINTPVTPTGARPQPTWGRIINLQSDGEHKYRALMVRLDKRYANRHQYLLSYTLAKQDNTGAGTQPLLADFYNPGLDWGPGSADRRHTLVASGSILLKYDINLGAVWTLRSTMPFSARAGVDLNNDGSVIDVAEGDYVPGTTRNIGNRDNEKMLSAVNAFRALTGRAPISADQIDTNEQNRVDIRVSKAFSLAGNRRIELIAQVFNLFGTDMLGGIEQGWVENALSPSFGTLQTVQPRQQAELAIRFAF